MVDRAAVASARWNTLITERLTADGVAGECAEELATLVLTAGRRSRQPLDLVHRQPRALLETATESEADR